MDIDAIQEGTGNPLLVLAHHLGAAAATAAPGVNSTRMDIRVDNCLGIERIYEAHERQGQLCQRCGVQLQNCRSDKRHCSNCQVDRVRERSADRSRRQRMEKQNTA